MKIFYRSTFPGLVIWNETAHAKSLHAAFVATIQLLVNYKRTNKNPTVP